MDKVGIISSFISSALEVHVNIWDGHSDSLKSFEKQNCLLPDIQVHLTADTMTLHIGAMKKKIIYEIHDDLGLRVFLFLYEGKVTIVGPFVEEIWDEAKARELMAKLKLPASFEVPYKLYYCGYKEHNAKIAYRIIHAAVSSIDVNNPIYDHRIISGSQSKQMDTYQYNDPPKLDVVSTRYKFENEFMRMIQQGNPRAALDAYTKLSTVSGVLYSSVPDIQTALVMAAIGRTLMRKAAELAGLQPAIVDSISQAYNQKINAVKSYLDIAGILYDLIVEYSDAVRDMLRESFSPHVRKAADYIKLHLSTPLSLNEISSAIGITPNHLSHLFKKEAGVSISQYIAEKRCNRAHEMLLTTNLPVQDISGFVGYPDSNYFVKIFKSQYGTTPSEYRKKHSRNRSL